MRADGAVISRNTVLATITAGIAKVIMKDCTNIAQQNNGMRLSDMPGARMLEYRDDQFHGDAQR